MRKQTGKQDLRLNYQSDGGILLFREAVEEKKLMLHFSVLREALIWKAPCSLWPVLWLTRAPKVEPFIPGPLRWFPLLFRWFACVLSLLPQVFTFPIQEWVVYFTGCSTHNFTLFTWRHSHHHQRQSSCSQTITPGSSWEQRLEKGRLRPWEQAGRDLLPQLCLFQDLTKATRSWSPEVALDWKHWAVKVG